MKRKLKKELEQLKLEKFDKLLICYLDKETTEISYSIAELIEIICDYYKYTLASFELTSIALIDFVDKKNSRNKMIATAFGIYTNGNVCLQITKKLNDYMKDFSQDISFKKRLNKITESKETSAWADEFRTKRNLITVHPVQNKNSKGNCECFPDRRAKLGIYGTSGFNFEISSLLTWHIHKEYKIKPLKEMEKLKDYF